MSDTICMSARWDEAFDAVAAAPDNHVVLHEDEDVRVLMVNLPAGMREPLHHHRWPSVFVIHHVEPIRDFDENGAEQPPPKAILDAIAEGSLPLVVRMPPQPLHSVENLGNEAIRGVRIELKSRGMILDQPPP